MPRSLTFQFDKVEFNATLVKVDRSQLYGSVSVQTSTIEGERCEVATLASDGRTLIPKGGTAMGYVNPEGLWIDRDELSPVDLSGEPVAEVESSFDAPVLLEQTASTEEFLDHNVRLVYRLEAEEPFPEAWLASLNEGNLYQFGFSYRGGVGHDPAFILSDADAQVWMLITQANDVQLVGLEQAAVCMGENLEKDEDEADTSLDFSML